MEHGVCWNRSAGTSYEFEKGRERTVAEALRMQWRHFASATPAFDRLSNPDDAIQLRRGDGPVDKLKLACIHHFACRIQQPRHRGAVQRGGKADAPDVLLGEFRHRERLSLDPHHKVERL